MRRILSFLLAATLLLGLTACGKKAEEAEPDRYGGIRYLPVFRELDMELDSIHSGCVMGDYVYLTGSVTTNEAYYDREARLLRVPLDGGEIESLPCGGTASEDRNVICSSEGLAVAPGEEDTLWLLEKAGRMTYDFPEDFDPYDMSQGTRGQYYVSSERGYVLHRLDGDGNELSRREWPRQELEDLLGMDYIDEVYISSDGRLTFWNRWGENELVTIDQTGQVLGRVKQEDQNQNWQGVVRLGDGRLAMSASYMEGGSYGTRLTAMPATGGAWEESWDLPDFTSVYDGDENALFYYNAGSDLLAWRDPAESAEDGGPAENLPLLSWVNTGLSGSGDRSVTHFLPDGRLVVVSGGGMFSTDEAAELAVLTPTDDPPEKAVLTLGTPQLLSDIEEAVWKFNRENHEYCIEVREYIDYAAGEDWQDGIKRLAAEVGAGHIPDILDMSGMPLYRWAASGVLEDLWPWIDLDRDIGREDLMIRVLEADSICGKLYEVASGFSFITAVGMRNTVGDRTAWTMEEMEQVLENMECLAMPNDREWMLRSMLQTFWDRLVDWERGTCGFDSPEFREILAFCGRFPEDAGVTYEERAEMIRDGALLLESWYPSRFWDVQELETDLQGEASFVGLPNPWGETGSSFNLGGGLAMASGGKHKEGAWAFLRTMLLPEGQSSDLFLRRFPLNKEAFEEMAQMDGNGRYGYSDASGKSHTYRKASREEYDKIMALYEAVDGVYRWDESLGGIIMEIAGAYFAGDKTLDETVELIQNRANLYLREQK